jgi:hypothetical protein
MSSHRKNTAGEIGWGNDAVANNVPPKGARNSVMALPQRRPGAAIDLSGPT